MLTECAEESLSLDHFLNQYGVDICVLSAKFLNPGQAFRHANYVCHRTDRQTAGGGTANLVRRGTVHHSGPVSDLVLLDACAAQIILSADR